MSVTNADDTIKGPSASRVLEGLTLHHRPQDARQARPTSSPRCSRPLSRPSCRSPCPTSSSSPSTWRPSQVSSTASPPFDGGHGQQRVGLVGAAVPSSSSGAGGSGTFTGNTGTAAGTFTGDSGAGGSFAPAGSSSHARRAPPAAGARPAEQPGLAASALAPAFKGIGAALVLLGLLAAAALALPTGGSTTPARILGSSSCADGDPLMRALRGRRRRARRLRRSIA